MPNECSQYRVYKKFLAPRDFLFFFYVLFNLRPLQLPRDVISLGTSENSLEATVKIPPLGVASVNPLVSLSSSERILTLR